MNHAENEPEIPVVDNVLLREIFEEYDALHEKDAELAQQQAQLEAQLAAVQAKRQKGQFELRMMDYVDDFHRRVALLVRPMVLDLVALLKDADSVFSSYMVPERYEDDFDKARRLKDKKAAMLERLSTSLDGPGKPALKPLWEARTIAVCPSMLAMRIWIAEPMPLRRPKVILKPHGPFYKALVLGFDSGWYVRPLKETGVMKGGQAKVPEAVYHRFDTHEESMAAAFEYVVTGILQSTPMVPPELLAVYGQAMAKEAEWETWREARRTQAKDQGEKSFPFALLMGQDLGQPKDLRIWHV